MSNLALIPLQPADFDTQQNCDWLDGLPLIGAPGFGGSNAGADNLGKGSLAVTGVDVGTAYGAHIVTVTGIANGQTLLSVTDPDDVVTGKGVAGLPLYAGGLDLTLSQVAGQAALAVDDTFAVAVIPVAVDIFAMAIDREIPVQTGPREIMNLGGKVRQGERLLVRSARRRLRSCELTRRWSIIDGDGRRYDYEPERFEAYGPVTPEGAQAEPEITGPMVPLNAVPGRGRWVIALAWECNMLQHAIGWPITQVLSPVEFEIVPREALHTMP